MTQTEQFDADVAGIEPEGLVTFTYDGKPYVAQRTPIADKLAIDDAGYELNLDLMLEVRTKQFTDASIRPPANTETIKIGDIEYQIASVTPDQYGVVNTYGVKEST